MIKTSTQLKALIRNQREKNSCNAQILLRLHMMERFLERLSLSKYKNSFILKGGFLITSIVGVQTRSTMDIDATIRNNPLNEEQIKIIMQEIFNVPLDDGVKFSITQISQIMENCAYSGIRVSLTALFDGIVVPFKIDISTGDIITPKEITHSHKIMLANRYISLIAYNLETILSEKLESIITRNSANTRMRDYYDVHILLFSQKDSIDILRLKNALIATFKHRSSEHFLKNSKTTIIEIKNSIIMKRQWIQYQKKFSYASKITWDDVIFSAYSLIDQCNFK